MLAGVDGGDQPTVVCVVGAPRSGTSLTMRMVNLLGVHIGPEHALKPAGPANPKGFWEHAEINRINHRLIKALGGSRDEPFTPPPGWARAANLGPERAAARETIAETFDGHALWGWKDTSNSLVLPFWQQLLPEMRYVVCLRNPLDIAASLGSGPPTERVLELWPTYMASMLSHTSGRPRLLVAYEDWLEQPSVTVARLSRFIGVEPPSPGDDTAVEIERYIDGSLHHHRTGDDAVVADERMTVAGGSLYLMVKLLHAIAPDSRADGACEELHTTVDRHADRTR